MIKNRALEIIGLESILSQIDISNIHHLPDNVFVEGIRQTPLRKKIIEELTNDPKAHGEEIYRNYLRNRKLIDLTETPSPVKQEIIYNYEQQDKWSNRSKVFPFLVEKRCRLLLEDVSDFIG